MRALRTVVAALCMALAGSGTAHAGANEPESLDAGVPVVCDPLHPAHFTYISERRGDDEPHVLFTAERLKAGSADGGVPGGDNGRLQAVYCSEPQDKLLTRGRWSVSERGELVITFMPAAVLPHVGHLGRLDVEGQIVSGTNARAIEIPGYREIGKAVPSPLEQASATESVIADVSVFLDAALKVGEARTRYQKAQEAERKKEPGSEVKPGEGFREPGSTPPQLQSPEDWIFTHLFRSPGQYERITRNILEHSAAFAVDTSSSDAISVILRRLVLVAQLGQQVLARREELTTGMAERAAASDVEQDKEAWRQNLDRLNWVRNELDLNKWKLSQDIQTFICGRKPFEFSSTCTEREFASECEAFRTLTRAFCGANVPTAGLNLLGQQTKLLDSFKVINAEAIFGKFDARLARRRQYYRSLDSSALYSEYAALRVEGQSERELDGISDIPYLTPLVDEFEQIASVLNDESKPHSKQDVVTALRKQLSQISASGWREIRLQPKAIGAREGDTIELTITYFPSGTSAVQVTEERGGVSQSTTGTTRPARWTIRFLVDRIGFYVSAGPRLSLVATLSYEPEAENFRGAQGSLVPGLGVDLLCYDQGIEKTLPFINGFGFRVDYLDFDARQSIEIGLEGHLLLLRGILSVGAGYNFSTQSPRFSGRSMYFSLGLGVEQMLDEALKLARQSDR